MGDEDGVEATESLDGGLYEFVVLVEVVEVELMRFYACGASYCEVVFDGFEFFRVAGDEV